MNMSILSKSTAQKKEVISWLLRTKDTHTHTIRYVNNCNVTVPAERHYFGLNILGISSVPPPDQGILSYQYTVTVLVILVPDFRHSETF